MFITDNQTIEDIGIFGKSGGIYELYNHTQTRGGALVLEEFLRYPLDDPESINRRSGIIQHFAAQGMVFPFNRDMFDAVAQYLNEQDERTRLSPQPQSMGQKLTGILATDTQYKNIIKGITSLISLMHVMKRFIEEDVVISCNDYDYEREQITLLLSEAAFIPIISESSKNKLSHEKLAVCDSILRFRYIKEVKKLLEYIYKLDAYISVATTAIKKGYVFAEAIPYRKEGTLLLLEEVKHPEVENAKGNDIVIDNNKNLVFLTGANMAGKSTFMKSVGIAVYLAHAGFPVAVRKMKFTVLDGMFSTINLPDNLGMGASHFYAEVLRVKKVVRELHVGKRLLVLFDEMFRGTNVKDAAEATIAIVKGFAKKTNSQFIISTHIIEAGEALQQCSKTIQYRYLPTKMQGHQPIYTYQLEEGITGDRHGMIIIRNEGILDRLQKGRMRNKE